MRICGEIRTERDDREAPLRVTLDIEDLLPFEPTAESRVVEVLGLSCLIASGVEFRILQI